MTTPCNILGPYTGVSDFQFHLNHVTHNPRQFGFTRTRTVITRVAHDKHDLCKVFRVISN